MIEQSRLAVIGQLCLTLSRKLQKAQMDTVTVEADLDFLLA
jgi:hypothetical protein